MLATPNKPSLHPDLTFLNYYQSIISNIKDLKNNGTTVISIGGGPRDILVPSFQTIDERADINTLTTSIPGVWRSTDHLCLLWCKQLILNIVRSLFDCVDTSQKPPAITDNIETRLKAFKWHFVQKMIKGAWAQGFDIIQGAEQLGGKLVNTRKWIGATEVATLLSSLRFK
uniref:Uncharacterized protein n=1 Tax=Trichogramma kaykai TaxID=54128 RepID=A0ABD2XCE0_9HYME